MIFLVGSVLAGLAHSMLELIAFRAVQGIGGGGLLVAVQNAVGYEDLGAVTGGATFFR